LKEFSKCDHKYSKAMAEKDETTWDGVTIDTNPRLYSKMQNFLPNDNEKNIR